MKRALFTAALIALSLPIFSSSGVAAMATPKPKLSGKPVGAEIAFVESAEKRLNALYPTPALAEKAGYVRYSNEDRTGAISYVNPAYWTSTLTHPSQLWYDVHGHLLGADYSVLKGTSTKPPVKWGLNPARWFTFPAHVHWVLKTAKGYSYEHATSVKKFLAAGGNLAHPSPQTVVALHKAASAAEVSYIFAFPTLWDTEIWVDDNPAGAFAAANPNVKPSHKHASGGMGM